MDTIAHNEKTLEVASLDQLPEAAAALLAFLAGNPTISTILFEGEMGAGKTTFIKAICHELGVTDYVSSPTFSIVNEYLTGSGQPVYHFDFYRINDEQEALNIGVFDYFDSGNLCLIEWPTKIPNLLPDHYLLVTIAGQANGQRKITLKQY